VAGPVLSPATAVWAGDAQAWWEGVSPVLGRQQERRKEERRGEERSATPWMPQLWSLGDEALCSRENGDRTGLFVY